MALEDVFSTEVMAALQPAQMKVFMFKERPNMHPVFHTGIEPVHVKQKSRKTTAIEDLPEDEQPTDPWAKFIHKQYYAPVEIPPPDGELPANWSRTEPIPAGKHLKAYDSIWLTIPAKLLRSPDSLEIEVTKDEGAVFQVALSFMIKALMSPHEGSKADGFSGDKRLWYRPSDPASGAEAMVPPKVIVMGEVLTKDFRQLLLEYCHEKFGKKKGPAEINLSKVMCEVEFRRRQLAKDNFSGIRLLFAALDPKINFGRCLQHQQWRNEVGMGKASGEDIIKRYDFMCAEHKRKQSEAVKNRLSSSSSSKDVDRFDVGPAAENDKQKSLDEAEHDAEVERVLGDEAPEKEPPGESTGGGGKNHGGGAPGLNVEPGQQQQQQETQRQKEERQRNLTMAKLGALGIKLFNSDRDNKSHLKRVNHIHIKSIQKAMAKSGKPGVRPPPSAISTKPADEKELISRLDPKDWYRALVHSQSRLVEYVYQGILNRDLLKEMDIDTLRNESQDLGNWNHPLNPRRHFTFRNSVDSWLKDPKVRPCPEQCDEANYIDPYTGEIKFPIPYLVWRMPDGQFRLKTLETHRGFWWFSAFEEQLAASEKKARDNREQSIARTNFGIERSGSTTNDAGILDGDSSRTNYHDEEQSEEKDITHSIYLDMPERRMVLSNRMLGSVSTSKSKRRAGVGSNKALFSGISLRMAEAGIENPNQKAQRAQRDHVISDVVATHVKDADSLYRRVMTACENVPGDRALLLKLFREHQMQQYKNLMRPGTKGVNDVFAAHAAYLDQPNPTHNYVNFKFTGFSNLTYNGSLIAEFMLRSRVNMGMTNSHHIFFTAMWNVSPNAYRASRRIGLHMMKVGAPGIGKSFVDKWIKECKVEGSVIESMHSSNLSKFVDQCTDDRFYMEDEASFGTLGDTSKARGSGEHQAITMHKVWLSNDQLAYTVWDKDPETGATRQKRKVVSARGVHSVNANWQHTNKDTAGYDRYLIWNIMPWYSPVRGQSNMFCGDENPELKAWTDAYSWDLRKFDTVNYRLCKMIDMRAAAQPNIMDFTTHMVKGMAILSGYGIAADAQKRTLQKANELAATMVISAAVMQEFSGPWSPGLEEEENKKYFIVRQKPWSEDFLKRARYRLFMTEDLKMMTLSQVYRQLVKDYSGWDVLSYLARVKGGFTEAFFKDLFNKCAWKKVEKEITLPDGSKKKVVTKREKYFSFSDIESLIERRNGNYEELPDYVKEEDLLYMRFEAKGILERGVDNEHPVRQHRMPYFMYYRERSRKDADQSHQENVIAKGMRAVADAGARSADAEIESRERPEQVGAPDVPRDEEEESKPKEKGTVKRKFNNAKGGSYGQDGEDKENLVDVIDPNWIYLPYNYSKAAEIAARDLSSNAYTQGACIENMLRQLKSKTLMVPVLEKMAHFGEEPRFVYSYDENNVKTPLMQCVPIVEEVWVPHSTIDPLSGAPHAPGARIKISTMGLMCFRPYRVLFEFLSAMEYNHTIPMNAVIDVPVRGREGIQHIHNIRPNPDVSLNKGRFKELPQTVLRTLFMEHTTTVWSEMPGISKVLDADLDREKIRKFIQEKNEIEKRENENANEPVITKDLSERLKKLMVKNEKSIDEQVEERYQELKRRKEEVRTHIPFDSQYAQGMRNTASEMSRKAEVYNRYHIFEEYEKWLLEEYGKVIKPDENGQVEKVYYPMVMERVFQAYLRYSPYYKTTRECFDGKLVQYPKEVVEDFDRLERESMGDKADSEPGLHLLQSKKACEARINRYLRNLRFKRDPTGLADFHDEDGSAYGETPESKAEKQRSLEKDLSAKMGFGDSDAEPDYEAAQKRSKDKAAGILKTVFGAETPVDAASEADDHTGNVVKDIQTVKAKKHRKSSDEDEAEDSSEAKKRKHKNKKEKKRSHKECSGSDESEDSHSSTSSTSRHVQALLPDILNNDASRKAKISRRNDKPSFMKKS